MTRVPPSDCNGADNNSVLQHDTDNKENKVQQKHEKAQTLAHSPLASGNGHDDKQQHEEEKDDGAEQAIAAHLHWLQVIDNVEKEPGEWQTGGRTEA